ncbi:MAG: TonB-dependent receptor [Gammaproteobacteria bacterium]|nr:TonB-dependent receptor [Gammaproteobacteria bacterium]
MSLRDESVPIPRAGCPWLIAILAVLAPNALIHGAARAQQPTEEIEVVGVTPTEGIGLSADKVARYVQSANSEDLQRSQALDLADFMNRKLGSVNINSAQNNPLQPDVQFRGFTASPLLGLPQGLAVYQDGARINEPLGDAVSWDLLPQSAVHSIDLIGGANPVFGLNTLGGALVVDMKNGFNFQGHDVEAYGGSWDRAVVSAQSGGNNGVFGYYVNVHHFREDGWRDLSESDATNVYASLSWRAQRSSLDFAAQYGDTTLNGNGAAPVGLLAIDREAIFTAPDITGNDMRMVTLEGTHFFSDELQLSGSAFYRGADTDSFNGDASEYQRCLLGNGERLLEGFEDDALAALGLDEDDVCDGVTHADATALEAFLNGLGPAEEFNIEDLGDELSGTGILSDAAINNTSRREQDSRGADLQLTFLRDLFARENHLVVGVAYYDGDSTFDSRVELADQDPVTRSSAGLGTGTFVDSEATHVDTSTRSYSIYFTDTLSLTERLHVTLAGRWNSTDVKIRDLSGERPELDGEHTFERFNPAFGLAWQAGALANLYASYSESSRAPTPIELSCNEGVFQIARANAIADGEDPDDIDLECRLPNAFLADPPLAQVVAKSFEAGARGRLSAASDYHVGFFHTVNHDDIIFQTTGRATGLFANVDQTRRLGVEAELSGIRGGLDWYASYSYVQASFEDDFRVLSPNHPDADGDGEIQVTAGDRIPGIPEHTLKIGGDYSFPAGVALGAELIFNSDQHLRGDESNRLGTIDGYALVNLRARYRVTGHLELFARVDNVFDAEYENFGLLGEDPGEVLPLADTRPFFLGAGAPRAGWVGLRLRL